MFQKLKPLGNPRGGAMWWRLKKENLCHPQTGKSFFIDGSKEEKMRGPGFQEQKSSVPGFATQSLIRKKKILARKWLYLGRYEQRQPCGRLPRTSLRRKAAESWGPCREHTERGNVP